MRCEEMEGLYDLYVDHGLPEETRARVERHLMTCHRCAYEVRSLEQGRSMLKDAYPAALSAPDFRERTIPRLCDALSDVLTEPDATPETQWPLPLFRSAAE